MKKLALLIIASVLLAYPGLARGQGESPAPPAGMSSLQGNVRDASGAPVEGATVKAFLRIWDGEFESFTLTEVSDSGGAYVFSNLPAASVSMTVEAGGFAKLYRESIKVEEDERIGGLDFILLPGLTISGRVTNSQGEPLQGIAINTRVEYGEGLSKPAVRQAWGTVVSSEQGLYSVGSLQEGIYTVKARSPNHVSKEIARVEAGSTGVDFVLRDGGGVSGTVIDKTSGGPVLEARVSLKAEQAPSHSSREKADENGFYQVSNLLTGFYTLKVTAEGYMDASRTGIAVHEGEVTEGINFSLLPKPRVRGTVTLEGGGAAEGVELRLSSAEGFMSTFTGGPFSGKADAVADGRGRYEITKGEPGKRYAVKAHLPGYVAAMSEPFQLVPGRDQESVDLVLKKGLSLSGEVTDEKRNPIPEAKVKAKKKVGSAFFDFDRNVAVGKGRDVVLTDDMGGFTLDGLGAGSYTIKASAKGYSPAQVDNVKLVEDSEPEPLAIVLGAGLTITGRVTDASGEPLEGVRVSASGRGETGYSSSSANTDGEGRYEIGSLSAGKYKVRARLKGYSKEKIEGIEPPAGDVDFTLSSAGRIAGRVTGKERGGIITRFRYATAREPFSRRTLFRRGRETFSEDGTFETRPLDPGSYAVIVRAEGYAPEKVEGIEVESGETANVEIKLAPETSIRGEVFDEKTRRPVTGARIALLLPKEGEFFGFAFGEIDLLKEPVLSNENGAFSIGSLPAGRFSLKVTHPDYAEKKEAVKLNKEGEEVRVEIALAKGRAVSGIVVDKNSSAPIAGARVEIFSGADGGLLKKIFGSITRKSSMTAVSDSSGRWEIVNLPPGEYRIRATHHDYAVPGSKEIIVKPDADLSSVEISLSSGTRVSGTVKDTSGKAIYEASVIATGEAGFKQVRTDKSGRYALEHLGPGSYTISCMPGRERGATASNSKRAVIAPNEDMVLDFVIGGNFAVSGRVLKEGVPVAGIFVSFSKEELGEGVSAGGKSGEDGSYQILGLPSGSYEIILIKIDPKKRLSYRLPEPVVVSGDLENLDLNIPVASISGTVVDVRGNPLEGARVSVKKKGEKGEKRVSSLEEKIMRQFLYYSSDTSGRFEVPALCSGSYLVTATKEGFGQAVEEVTLETDSGAAEITLALKPGCTLRAKINDARTGKTVEKAAIMLKDKKGAVVKMDELSAKDGLFTVGDLASGEYRLEAAAEGLVPGALDSVKVGPKVKGVVELSLGEGGTLAASVADEDDRPLMGVLLELRDGSGKPYQSLWSLAKGGEQGLVTGSKGKSRLEGLPEGIYTVKAGKAGYASEEAKITVEKGKETKASFALKKK